MKTRNNPFIRRTTLSCLAILLAPIPASAATVYWDANGSTTGAGTTPSGTWGADAFWSADPNGETATAAWIDGDDAVFSAGTDATNPFTVSLGAALSAVTLKVEEGSPTLSAASATTLTLTGIGGAATPTLNLPAGTTLTVGDNATIDMTGAADQIIPGGGTLAINGAGATVRSTSTAAGYLTIDGATQVNVTSGTLSHAGTASTGNGSAMVVGTSSGSNAKLTVSGGTVTTAGYFGLVVGGGAGSTGTVDLNSGSITVSNNTYGLFLNNNDTSTATFNLNGGTLTVGKVTKVKLPGTSTFYFNGGTLKAAAASTSFWGSSATARGASAAVKSGGALINDDGKGTTTTPVAIWANLLEDGTSTGGGLTKSGTGAVALYGLSTYTGKTTISAGTLIFNSIGYIGATESALGAPATVANGTIDLTGILHYNGATVASTDRIINLTGAGTINSSGGASSGLVLDGNITGNAALTLRGSRSLTVNGNILIGQANGLTKTDAGTVRLTHADNDFGTLLIASGKLSVDSIADNGTTSAAGKGPSTNSASIQLGQSSSNTAGVLSYTGFSDASSNRTIRLNNATSGTTGGAGGIESAVSGYSLTLSGNVTAQNAGSASLTLDGSGDGEMSGLIGGATGTISLAKSGAGTWKLSNANTYTGTTTLNTGILNLGSAETPNTSGPLGKSASANPGSIVFRGGTLQYSSLNNHDYSGRFSTASGQFCNIDVNGRTVTFGTALTSNGGTLSVADTAGGGKLILTQANTYTGATAIASGATLQLGNGTSGQDGSLVTSGIVNDGSLIYHLDGSQSVGYAITGFGSLTKSGAGTLLLASSASLPGGTITANGGTLRIQSDAAGRTVSNPIVLSGATLTGGIQDNAGLGGAITVNTATNKVTHTFLSSDTLSVPGTVTADALLVGGGGGGSGGQSGSKYGSGGGGGRVVNETGISLVSGPVVVGAGGATGGSGTNGTAGGDSSLIGTWTAAGGSGGVASTGVGGASGSGFAGGASNSAAAGGGGGSSAAGSNAPNTTTGGAGGPGSVGTLTGLTYGGGGGGQAQTTQGAGGSGGGGAGTLAGAPNSGGGGGGIAAGGSGLVVVQYGYAQSAGTLTLTGTVEIPSASTLDAYGSGGLVDVQGIVSGSGALTIASSNSAGGIVRLSAANIHTGTTTVESGTLEVTGSLGNTAVEVRNTATLAGNGGIGGSVTVKSGGHLAIPVAAASGSQVTRAISGTLTLESGNILDLTAAATPAAGTYTLVTATGGISATLGTINRVGFTGGTVSLSGDGKSLLLTIAAGSGYDAWKTANAGGQGPGLDFDSDGVENGIEWFMGIDSPGFTANPAPDNSKKITWPKRADYSGTYGTGYLIQTSNNLVDWNPVLAGDPNLQDGPAAVSYTLTGTGKLFTRLSVTP